MSEKAFYNTLMSFKNIVIIMAMEVEALPLITRLRIASPPIVIEPPLSIVAYQGSFESAIVTIVVNGKDKRYAVDSIGTQPATLAAFLAIKKFQPDCIINAGTAGGFQKKGGVIGDVYVSAGSICYHDRRILLPGFREYGIGSYPVFDVGPMAKQLHCKTGIVSTGNSLDATEKDLEVIAANNASVKEMEAAAIASIADCYQIPMIAVKAITDIVDGDKPTHEEFLQNLAAASENLQQKVVAILKYLVET